jgi:hypothetical protein
LCDIPGVEVIFINLVFAKFVPDAELIELTHRVRFHGPYRDRTMTG